MKQITKERQAEEAKFFCDNHPDKECFSELRINSWYGSKYDLNYLVMHLCDDCLQVVYEQFENDYHIKPTEIPIE